LPVSVILAGLGHGKHTTASAATLLVAVTALAPVFFVCYFTREESLSFMELVLGRKTTQGG
jgi:hypothetical protein